MSPPMSCFEPVVAVARHGLLEGIGGEDVVAHRGEHLVGVVGQALGVARLLEERGDLRRVGVVDLDDAELVGERDRLPDRGDGARGAATRCAARPSAMKSMR